MSERPATDTYAGGIDASQVRAMVAVGAQRGWGLAGVDVKTAFLQVPPGRSKAHGRAGLRRPRKGGNLWRVKSRRVTGARTSEPEWASATEDLRFCGFEFAVDGGVKMHQQSYVTDLLDQHQIVKGGTLAVIGVPEEEGLPSPGRGWGVAVAFSANAARHTPQRSWVNKPQGGLKAW